MSSGKQRAAAWVPLGRRRVPSAAAHPAPPERRAPAAVAAAVSPPGLQEHLQQQVPDGDLRHAGATHSGGGVDGNRTIPGRGRPTSTGAGGAPISHASQTPTVTGGRHGGPGGWAVFDRRRAPTSRCMRSVRASSRAATGGRRCTAVASSVQVWTAPVCAPTAGHSVAALMVMV